MVTVKQTTAAFTYHPEIIKEFEPFEKEVFNRASSLKFRNTTDNLQKQLEEDISSTKAFPDVLIFADKTNNIYKGTPEQYKKLLLKGQRNEDLQKIFRSFRKVN